MDNTTHNNSTINTTIMNISSSKIRLSNEHLSIQFMQVMHNNLGFNTVGQSYRFLKQAKPTAKLGCGLGHVRVARLLKELCYTYK